MRVLLLLLMPHCKMADICHGTRKEGRQKASRGNERVLVSSTDPFLSGCGETSTLSSATMKRVLKAKQRLRKHYHWEKPISQKAMLTCKNARVLFLNKMFKNMVTIKQKRSIIQILVTTFKLSPPDSFVCMCMGGQGYRF